MSALILPVAVLAAATLAALVAVYRLAREHAWNRAALKGRRR